MLTLFRDLFAPPRHMLLLITATWIGLTLAEKRAARHNVSKDELNNITFYGLLAFVIGGRISFVLQNLPAFLKSPLGIVSINLDLFDSFGAVAAALITMLVYGQRKNLVLWNTLDALTPFFAALAVGLGLAHLAAGTAFGKETDLPFGIELWNATRHPTQIYETLAALLTLGFIWLRKQDQHPGMLFLTCAALTAFSQIVIQAFRADVVLIFNGVNRAQVIAWMLLAICFIFFEARLKERT
jgi:phosphatidylglycerol:prolipoprotein diacylglycerol transferase